VDGQDGQVATSRTRACLRIGGDHGTTAAITETLGLAPTTCHDIGEPRSARDGRPWPALHWALDSDLADTAGLEEHLHRLCDVLGPRVDALRGLRAQGFRLDWFCFVDVENGQGGVLLRAALLERLAAIPADLDLDIYG
jgi:hypothetical protein